MYPSHHLRCSGEQARCAVHQPDADAELLENSQEQLRTLDWEAETTKSVEKLLTVKCATVLSPWGFS